MSAPVPDAGSYLNSGGGFYSDITWNHTLGAGANYLVVTFTGVMSGGTSLSVTCGGVAMSAVVSDVGGGGPAVRANAFELANPPTGTQSISITGTLGTSISGSGIANSFSGVNTGSPHGTPATNVAGGPTPAATITIPSGSIGYSACSANWSVNPLTAGKTLLTNGKPAGKYGGSTEYTTTTGSVGMDWSFSSDPAVVLAFPINGTSGRLSRSCSLEGLGGAGQQSFNPSLT